MPRDFPQRGEIYFADLDPAFGSEQAGRRPVLIIQNDAGNEHSPAAIIAAITSAPAKVLFPVDVVISSQESGLIKGSRVLLGQIRTIDQRRLEDYVGRLSAAQMAQVDQALTISLGLMPTRPPGRSN
ncbi:MAG: type II toxin-antitoxin system PemK/MazF family toxin [Roseiflexaceae bacterium]